LALNFFGDDLKDEWREHEGRFFFFGSSEIGVE